MPVSEELNQQHKIRYAVPLEAQIWTIPDNTLIKHSTGFKFIYAISKDEYLALNKEAQDKQTSFDEAFFKKFESRMTNSPEAHLLCLQFQPHYGKVDLRFKLDGAVREAHEGETAIVPEYKLTTPKQSRLKLKHVVIITFALAVVTILYVLFFTNLILW